MRPSAHWAEGDNYLVGWDDLGMALEFTRIRETESAMRALVTPVVHREGVNRSRMLAPIMVNLFTLADRERVAKAISERVKGDGSPTVSDWKDCVERAFSRVIDWRSEPEPLMDLSEVIAPDDDGFLIWPVLARNQVNVLLADQKSGKSYDVLLMAVLVAMGNQAYVPEPWKLNTTEPIPVLYIDAETDLIAQHRRLSRISAGLHLPRLPKIKYRHIRPPFTDHLATLRADVDRFKSKDVLVIVDSLTFAAGGDLNSAEVAGATMNAVGELGPNVTKLATAHYNKAARRDTQYASVMGSGLFEFKARNLWMILRQSEAGGRTIEQAWQHRYANDSPLEKGFGLSLTFNESNTAVEFKALAASDSSWLASLSGNHEDRIRSVLFETETWKATTSDIATWTRIDEKEVSRVCGKMEDVRMIAGGRGRGKVATWELVRKQNPNGVAQNGDAEKSQIKVAPIESSMSIFPGGAPESAPHPREKLEKSQGKVACVFSEEESRDDDDYPF